MSGHTSFLIYALIFAAAVLALQTFIGMGKHAFKKAKMANDRMQRLANEKDATVVLAKLRTRRGMTRDGDLAGAIIWLKKLVLHSGLPLGNYGIYAVLLGSFLSLGIFAFLLKSTFMWAMIGCGGGLILPIAVLKFLAKRRRSKAVSQLPDALDVIVRSLGAGHPVPVAMALVGREMPDPIGTEFGVASDEISYGASISQTVQRLAERVGHEDFDLFSAMIRLQERTGGNLAELLRKSADTIRNRQKMRLKIKAASAEGRMSAMILNIAPIVLFLLINLAAPDFYGDVKGHKVITYATYGIIGWMLIGNLVMKKMINFKI
jgi:tight adherence protein B